MPVAALLLHDACDSTDACDTNVTAKVPVTALLLH